MLWIISVAAVAGIAAAGVFAALWWVQWRKARHYKDAIIRKDKELDDIKCIRDGWKRVADARLERERAAVEQAKVFERVSKTMEEHAAAERGRADRLAAELRESEDEVERLRAELDKVRCAESAQPMGEAAGGALGSSRPTGTMDQLAQEFANIAAYNGTAEGQVDLTDE